MLLLCGPHAWAIAPVSYRTATEETWEQIALRHGVTEPALRASNPQLSVPAQDWIRLPPGVGPRSEPSIAIIASAYKEIADIVAVTRIGGVYRIVGREFHVGTLDGNRIVAGVAGGNMNNAAIGATVLLQHFDIRVMGFVGIAGGGPTTRVGDVLVASGAIQHDQGNWYDFEVGEGRAFSGLTWQMRGQPVISDAGREASLVLFPQQEMLARMHRSVAAVELPPIGADVAAFHGTERYRPSVLIDGWSASGAQFVTSYHLRTTLQHRIELAAQRMSVSTPRHFIVDQEDFAAIHAATEHGVPWFIVRAVVDLAASKKPGAGIPLDLYNTPEEIPAWLAANGQQSHKKDFDWSYFYRVLTLVVRPILQELGTEGTPSRE
ncbi:hypothetical protein [Povalibacter sp.]|uniref:5'-methylthioadenosine/S-adenosylhomocysteine nucleosidase family protein n=1 Tax=Povalibacter sp. TaxID=1962978 RepID=UPI002F3EC158